MVKSENKIRSLSIVSSGINKMKQNMVNKFKFSKHVLPVFLAAAMTVSLSGCKGNSEKGSTSIVSLDNAQTQNLNTNVLEDGTVYTTNTLADGMVYITDYKSPKGKEKVFVYSNDEFREYLDNKNPTFEDLRVVLNDNENIDSKYKEKISDYIDGLEKKDSNVDLSVFYYNLQHLKIEVKSLSEIKKESGRDDAFAYFVPATHVIYIPEESEEYTDANAFEHELSHAVNSTCLEDGNRTIVRTNRLCIPIEKDGATSFYLFGESADEGITEAFTYFVLGRDYIQGMDGSRSDYQVCAYLEFADEIELLSSVVGSNILEVQERGFIDLMNHLYELGISNPSKLLDSMKQESGLVESINDGCAVRFSIYTEVFESFAKKLVERGYTSNEIYKETINCLENSFLEKLIADGDFLVSILYSSKQEELKEKVISTVSSVLETEGMEFVSSYDEAKTLHENTTEANSGNDSVSETENEPPADILDSLFIYETTDHEIKYCYILKDAGENEYYYDSLNDKLVDDNEILYGEYLNILQDENIVKVKVQDDYKLDISVDFAGWQNYFTNKNNNNGASVLIIKPSDLYVYIYKVGEEAFAFDEAYRVIDKNNIVHYYDKDSLEEIDSEIVYAGDYANNLVEDGLIEISGDSKVLIPDYDLLYQNLVGRKGKTKTLTLS